MVGSMRAEQALMAAGGPLPRSPKKISGLAYEPYGEELRSLDGPEEQEARSVKGIFAEPPGPRRDYQDALRAAFFRAKGEADEAIAARLGRSAAFVRGCSGAPDGLPPPRQVPRYIADHGLRCLSGGVEPFRPAELRRSFVQVCGGAGCDMPGVMEALCKLLPWEAAPALRRDYTTGAVVDTGKRLLRERASSGLALGIPSVDRAIAAIVEDFGIDDPGAYLLCNRYGDGRAFIAPHQHDFWSATFSFGASRVFLLDERPLLLGDGDVLIFGSQRHSVPKMPGLRQPRISLSLFWHPNWRADACYPEEKVVRWQSQLQGDLSWAAHRAEAVEQLSGLGVSEGAAVLALAEASDDVNAAAEALLEGSSGLGVTAAANIGNERERAQRRWHRPAEAEEGTEARAQEHGQAQGARGRWRQSKK